MFISSSVNIIKDISRNSPYPQPELKKIANSKVSDMSYNDMLTNEKVAYDGYSSHGWKGNYPGQQSGIHAGGRYNNTSNILPNGIYHEFDINPKVPGVVRDASRFVVSQDYIVYLTRDHYNTFFRIIK